jgi:hypothetical protein
MTNTPSPENLIFIDLEASSLGSASFPTEVGWAWLDLTTHRIRSGSCLIRPIESWLRTTSAWTAASERLTGITRSMLERDGVSPTEAMRRLMEAIGDRLPLSDAPDYDGHWLAMLAEAAGVDPIKLGDARAVIREAATRSRTSYAELEREILAQHRAEADARRLLTMYAEVAGISWN